MNDRTFDCSEYPCPSCGQHTLFGYTLHDEDGNHQHTHYVCTFWPYGGSRCGWHGWTIPERPAHGPLPTSGRPDWNTYFLGIAKAVSARADCRRAQHGAVVVDVHHRIISTGYNGPPPGDPKSCTGGDCPRGLKSYKELAALASAGYEDCISIHAEPNAIANATRDMRGGTIYITGAPCPMCAKLCAAAGLTVVHA